MHDFRLPLLPPDVELESRLVLRQLAPAHRYLAELKGVAATIPNESILINTLTLQEAKDSSEIENIITTHDELYKETLFHKYVGNPSAKEVNDYAAAWRRTEKIVHRRDNLYPATGVWLHHRVNDQSGAVH